MIFKNGAHSGDYEGKKVNCSRSSFFSYFSLRGGGEENGQKNLKIFFLRENAGRTRQATRTRRAQFSRFVSVEPSDRFNETRPRDMSDGASPIKQSTKTRTYNQDQARTTSALRPRWLKLPSDERET